jgi:hypothetical protein
MTNQRFPEASKTIERFTIYGVPASSIPALMKELNLNEDKFNEFMECQTAGYVGGEAIYYVDDIERFANNLPCID